MPEMIFIVESLIFGFIVRYAMFLGELRSIHSTDHYAAIGLGIGLVVGLAFCYLVEYSFGILHESQGVSATIAGIASFALCDRYIHLAKRR